MKKNALSEAEKDKYKETTANENKRRMGQPLHSRSV
jgi:hypothetical protein